MFICFDIGGSKTRIVATNDCRKFIGQPVVFETPQNFEEGISKIGEVVKEISGEEEITMVAGGIAGPLNKEKTRLLNSPNLENWADKPIKELLEKAIGARVLIENDSSIAGLGEAHFGAGRGKEIVAYLTVSTGVGGGRIVDGKIDRSAFGFEPGFSIIDFDKSACTKCESITAEDFLSGSATAHRFGKKAYEVKEEKAWNELAEWLSYLVNNIIVFWSPDVVVLGGSMIVGDPAIPLGEMEKKLKEILTIFPNYSEIKKAELGDFGGLYGAMALIKDI